MLHNIRWLFVFIKLYGSEDMDNNLIEIKGELIHCSKSGPSTYHSGIKFISTDELITKFVTQMIKVYNHRKNKMLIACLNNRLKESAASG